MKMTIYLPDDLAEMVKGDATLNVSAVCQGALRRELARRADLASLDGGMERIELEVEEGPENIKVAFTGRWLIEPDPDLTRYSDADAGAYYGVALTRRHRIAIYAAHVNDRWRPGLDDYDSLDDAAADGVPDRLISVAAAMLGEDRPIELDI